MGLDITLYRVCKEQGDDSSIETGFYVIDHFKPFQFDYEKTEYDHDFLVKLGRKYRCAGISIRNDGSFFIMKHKITKKTIELNTAKFPVKTTIVKAISEEEVGYHRGGVIREFYIHYEDIFNLFTKAEIEELYGFIEPQYKEYFKKTFVDPFIEGEMYVHLSW